LYFPPFPLSGTLIIVTDDAQWSYDVRGSYPSNAINHAAIKSKVDCNRTSTNTVATYK
jgi:hypothetical protein